MSDTNNKGPDTSDAMKVTSESRLWKIKSTVILHERNNQRFILELVYILEGDLLDMRAVIWSLDGKIIAAVTDEAQIMRLEGEEDLRGDLGIIDADDGPPLIIAYDKVLAHYEAGMVRSGESLH